MKDDRREEPDTRLAEGSSRDPSREVYVLPRRGVVGVPLYGVGFGALAAYFVVTSGVPIAGQVVASVAAWVVGAVMGLCHAIGLLRKKRAGLPIGRRWRASDLLTVVLPVTGASMILVHLYSGPLLGPAVGALASGFFVALGCFWRKLSTRAELPGGQRGSR